MSDILEVVLSAGYAFKEAFTRAFGEMYGITSKQAHDTDYHQQRADLLPEA